MFNLKKQIYAYELTQKEKTEGTILFRQYLHHGNLKKLTRAGKKGKPKLFLISLQAPTVNF